MRDAMRPVHLGVRCDHVSRIGYRATLKLDSGFPQERPDEPLAVAERKSPVVAALRILAAPPTGISNLTVRDKEATIFRAGLALNRV